MSTTLIVNVESQDTSDPLYTISGQFVIYLVPLIVSAPIVPITTWSDAYRTIGAILHVLHSTATSFGRHFIIISHCAAAVMVLAPGATRARTAVYVH